LKKIQPAWFSDHLGLNRVGNVAIDHFIPLAFDDELVRIVSGKVREIKGRTSVEFLLENITYYFSVGGEMTEWDFITRVAVAADCGLVLDLANLHANSYNHKYDPYQFLSGIPLDRVVEIHLAGGALWGDIYVDTHGHSVPRDVWEYLTHLR